MGSLRTWAVREAAITLANDSQRSHFLPSAKSETPLITAHSIFRLCAAMYRPEKESFSSMSSNDGKNKDQSQVPTSWYAPTNNNNNNNNTYNNCFFTANNTYKWEWNIFQSVRQVTRKTNRSLPNRSSNLWPPVIYKSRIPDYIRDRRSWSRR